MAELYKLTKLRGLIKARITRFKKHLSSLSDLPNVDIQETKSRLDKFKSCYEDFEKVQSEIELLDVEVPEDHEGERENFEDEYFRLIAQCEKLIENASHHTEDYQHCTGNTEDFIQNIGNNIHIKLPTINLQTFSGNYDQWLSFHDSFDSIIHKNVYLSHVQKLHYLRSSLKDEALQIIESLEITSDNYLIAWNLLKERYENKKIIINSHIKALFNLPEMTKSSHAALRQLSDGLNKNLHVLNALESSTDHRDSLLIYLIASKFDQATKYEWEEHSLHEQSPTLQQLTNFMKQRCQLLETMNPIKGDKTQRNNENIKKHDISKSSKQKSLTYATTNISCYHCKQPHALFQCADFLKLTPAERVAEAKRLKLCMNCLRSNHQTIQCKSANCKTCGKRHNTLLHLANKEKVNYNQTINVERANLLENPTTHQCTHIHVNKEILLSTALVYMYDNEGTKVQARVLLDSGSQPNFITQNLAQQLNIKESNRNTSVFGISRDLIKANKSIDVCIQSMHYNYRRKLSFLVLNKITEKLPIVTFSTAQMKIPKNINLADPDFNKSSDIDCLLGAEIFWDLICVGQIQLAKNQPIMQKTKLGWIFCGNYVPQQVRSIKTCHFTNMENIELNNIMKQFWEIEEMPDKKYTCEEETCEELFQKTTIKTKSGRFSVRLPTNENIDKLGTNAELAKKRFYGVERRFNADETLKERYIQFMTEYEALGHMTELEESEIKNKQLYYIPHHSVTREASTTTKLRVVFDASCKSETGLSLNDCLLTGPTIQDNLMNILIRSRIYKYCFAADINKMYRQIEIQEDQRRLQVIYWRRYPDQKLRTFQLNTVTYGTTSAPFLAIRALHESSIEAEKLYPEAAEIIKRDFYVDDLLSGANSSKEAIELRNQLIKILKDNGFDLRKWVSNHLEIIPDGDINTSTVKSMENYSAGKILGLHWDTQQDIFQYSFKIEHPEDRITKRNILADTARLFDPLGLLGPIIITAKVLMQKLWQLNLQWDESVPMNIHTEWLSYRDSLSNINNIKIPRRITYDNTNEIQLHGYSDASQVAYGACIYLRSSNSNEEHNVQLVCAKSRVAPVKSLSIPKLELCAAVLLVKLMTKITNALRLKINKQYFWTDSTIVLSWLAKPSNVWKTFVANRISQIQHHSDWNDWRHVNTLENPADLLSKGISPQLLQESSLWWTGPKWLHHGEEYWPSRLKNNFETTSFNESIAAEQRKVNNFLVINSEEFFERFSCFRKLQRTVAYCLRFIHNIKQTMTKKIGTLSVNELKNATMLLIKMTQNACFVQELNDLKTLRQVNKNSTIYSLNPFLDNGDIIRVGGRLKNSELQYDQKYPVILPNSYLSKLLIRYEHTRLFHAGIQQTLASLRNQFWIIKGRTTVRNIIKKCIICFKNNPTSLQPMMGNLPIQRTQPLRPFLNSGVDYCGPFYISDKNRRGKRCHKVYVCIFVCFSTKCVHLELVNDLTTSAFLNTLKRFISRRGRISNLYSDNAANFSGAARELKELHTLLRSQKFRTEIQDSLSTENINWHFIPARAPNFGGLWEAAIKSMKRHLRRTIGETIITYEDFHTIICQIEAILNSRPISPLSDDPSDLSILTPGHFLIGDMLTAPLEFDVKFMNDGRLRRWQNIQKMTHDFWQRWCNEYLLALQRRSKWSKHIQQELQVGDLVLIREENLPPLKWCLGRIIEVFPGNDNIIRVANVRTSSGIIKRPVNKLCILPLEID